jgi:uncharacterized cupredoxin-like copper-binding protein
MMKHILIATATIALINGAAAHGGEYPVTASQASSTKQQQDKSAAHSQSPANARRTVKVDMTDAMRFNPSSIKVRKGETVRFVVTNSGKLKHEMVLGSMSDLKKHAAMMRKNPEMEHAEENMVSVEPGKSGELTWRFTASGKVEFACLQPGHLEAGMKGKVAVK